jgi:hypothetical protein
MKLDNPIGGITRIAASALICAGFVALAVFPSLAQDVPNHPANLSLFFPISTNQDPTISTNLRLNLCYGRVGYIRGVDIGVVVSRTDRDMRGIQLTGIYSHTGGDVRGATATGVLNYVGGNTRGVQVAGLVNFNRGWFRGVQYATFFNYVQEEFTGIQWASIYNLSSSDGRYFQYASIANMVAGSFTGLQLSGGLNYVDERMGGVQMGVVNFAVEYRGAQAGALNFAREASGAQIGIFNYSRSLDGVPVGAVNIDRTNGNADWSSFASNYAAVSTGLRTTVHGYTSTLAVGFVDIEQERNDTVFLSWHYGYRFGLGEKASLTPDIGWVHVKPRGEEEGKLNDDHFALQARLAGEWEVSRIVNVFAGGGVTVRFAKYDIDADTKTDPLVFGGVALY